MAEQPDESTELKAAAPLFSKGPLRVRPPPATGLVLRVVIADTTIPPEGSDFTLP